MPNSNKNSGIRTSETVFGIIESIREEGEVTVNDIAQDFEVAKSTAHRHLTTLEKMGYLTKKGSRYRLGLRFLELGIFTRGQHAIYHKSREKVDELAKQTGERVQIMVKEHNEGVLLHRRSGEKGVQTDTYPGHRVHLHATAGGKAILAHLNKEEVEDIIEEKGLIKKTDETITDRSELFDELDKIRESGIAYNSGERIMNLRAVGVPILNEEGVVLGSLSVSGPAARFTGSRYKEELPQLLRGSVNEIELNIRYMDKDQTV